jgi:RNA polymerase sigma factor (sigma-70 family)
VADNADKLMAELTSAMAAGDKSAVERFYLGYFDRLYCEARRASHRDEAFCLDVVQEATLRVIRSVRRVKSEGQFAAWLNLVVRTTAFDLLRSEKRRRVREAVTVPVDAAGEDLESERAERIEWLRRQIAALDPELVRIIELRFDDRWTLAKIAALFGMSIGTIDGRLRRALKHLRDRAREDFE